MPPKKDDKGKVPEAPESGEQRDNGPPPGRQTPVEGSRLGSLGPQKFTLGGVEKKSFKPKLLKRGKPGGADTPARSEGEASRTSSPAPGASSSKAAPRRPPPAQGNKAPRKGPEYTQQSGLFSAGAAAEGKAAAGGRWGGFGMSGGGSAVPPPKTGSLVTMGAESIKDDEDAKDFDMGGSNSQSQDIPVTLPMARPKKEGKKPKSGKAKPAVKHEPGTAPPTKSEDEADEELSEEDDSHVIAVDRSRGGTSSSGKDYILQALKADPANKEKPHLVFFQLPPVLPLSPSASEPAPPALKQEESSGSATTAGAVTPATGATTAPQAAPDQIAAARSEQEAARSSGDAQPGFVNQLDSLRDGRMGKLYIHKSGKMRLVLGDVAFEVHQGMQTGFQETVVAIDPKVQNCVFMGDVERRFVCAPDLGELLKQ